MLIAIVCTMIVVLAGAVLPARISSLTFQRIEQTKGFDIFKSKLRITKFNRTTAVLNGTVDILIDLDNRFTLQVRGAYSRLGNNQFNEYPMKIAEQPMCDFMSGTYRDFQGMFNNTSTFPQVGPGGLCPLPAGHYWFKNVVFDPKYMPPVIPGGYWRLTLLVTRPRSTADLQVFMTVVKDWRF